MAEMTPRVRLRSVIERRAVEPSRKRENNPGFRLVERRFEFEPRLDRVRLGINDFRPSPNISHRPLSQPSPFRPGLAPFLPCTIAPEIDLSTLWVLNPHQPLPAAVRAEALVQAQAEAQTQQVVQQMRQQSPEQDRQQQEQQRAETASIFSFLGGSSSGSAASVIGSVPLSSSEAASRSEAEFQQLVLPLIRQMEKQQKALKEEVADRVLEEKRTEEKNKVKAAKKKLKVAREEKNQIKAQLRVVADTAVTEEEVEARVVNLTRRLSIVLQKEQDAQNTIVNSPIKRLAA
ncbi:MAG: hypothetical protein ABIE84_07385 [bacterium]